MLLEFNKTPREIGRTDVNGWIPAAQIAWGSSIPFLIGFSAAIDATAHSPSPETADSKVNNTTLERQTITDNSDTSSLVVDPPHNVRPKLSHEPLAVVKMSGLASKQESLKIFEKLKAKPANKVSVRYLFSPLFALDRFPR